MKASYRPSGRGARRADPDLLHRPGTGHFLTVGRIASSAPSAAGGAPDPARSGRSGQNLLLARHMADQLTTGRRRPDGDRVLAVGTDPPDSQVASRPGVLEVTGGGVEVTLPHLRVLIAALAVRRRVD